MGEHLLVGELVAICDNESFDCLPKYRVRNANDCSFTNAGQIVEDRFYFLGSDLFASALDDVIAPAHEIEEAIFVKAEKVPRTAHALAWSRAETVAFGCG